MGCCGAKKDKYVTPEKPKEESLTPPEEPETVTVVKTTSATVKTTTAEKSKEEPKERPKEEGAEPTGAEEVVVTPAETAVQKATDGANAPSSDQPPLKTTEGPRVGSAIESEEAVPASVDSQELVDGRKSQKKVSFAERRLSHDIDISRVGSDHMSSQDFQAEWDKENPVLDLPEWLKHGLGQGAGGGDDASSGFGSEVSD